MGQRLNPFGVLQVVHLVSQDLSISGKRAGLAGARSGLFMEQVRIVKEMREADKRNGRTGDMVRPRYLVWENVVGAFSSNKGKDFAAVLEEIIKIVEPQAHGIEVPEKGWPTWGGYHDEVGGRWSVVWRTHDAQYWGVPQRRRRISVVADFGGDTASEIQFDGESVSGDIAESGASGEGPAEAAERGFNPAVGDCMTAWDCQSKRIFDTNGKSPTLQGGVGGGVNNPAIFAAIPINDKATRWQGGGESRNHDGSGNGLGIGKEGDPSPTLTAGDRHGVMCAGFKAGQDAQAGGIGYGEEVSPALAASSGTNQTPAAMAFDTTQITSKKNRSRHEFGKPCHTLNANAHALCVAQDMTHACDVIRECGEQVPALQARMGTGGNQVPLTYQDVTGTLSPGAHAGSYNGQDAYNDMLVCGATPDVAHTLRAKANCAYREDAETYPVQNMVVRRLTPLECERLQGFPDGWTDIGDWVKTDKRGREIKVKGSADSPRYKALGNSIALPFWDWMLRRMARYLPEGATLGSLFDGISGFNVCWARIHGAECCRWSSEIEQFPIAVTKKHFGDEKSGETGDWEIFSGGMTW